MPKPTGMTKAGQIRGFIRKNPGIRFNVYEFALEFKTTPSNVIMILRELKGNGWKIEIEGRGPGKSFQLLKD